MERKASNFADGTAAAASYKEFDHNTADVQPPTSFHGILNKFQHPPPTASCNVAPRLESQSTADQILSSTPRVLRARRSNGITKRRDTASITSTSNPSSPRVVSISSPPKTKKKRHPSSYAPPSKYAHLPPLTDILEPNLICVFVGTNPGVRTATAGHAYAHPSNQFWKLLHSSGCTPRRCAPAEDVDLPRLFAMGNTNIVSRPTKDAAELSREEMTQGAGVLESKFCACKPEAVCIVGKGIWEAIWRYRYGKAPTKAEFRYGWQDERENMGKSQEGTEEQDANGNVWKGARVFVATSTSGLSASTKPEEKEAIWRPFGQWVRNRREERERG